MKENTNKYFSTIQVSRELVLDLTILKKISCSIEKTMGNKSYYYRNTKNQRLYRSDQIDEIENVITIKKKKKVSYSTAIYMVFSDQNSEIGKVKKEEKTGYQWFETMEIFMSTQEERIEKLTISLEALVHLENNNFKTIQQMNERIVDILNHVTVSQNQNQRSAPKKKKLELGNSIISNRVWMSKKEFVTLKTKIIYLPSIWKERKKKIDMSSKDKDYYTDYVKNAKGAYNQALKESRRVGTYYLLSNELKETLIWYGKFYDYIN